MVTFVMFEAKNVRFPKAERSIYRSSANVKRAFCANCGTPLTWEGRYKELDIIEFHVSTTDNPNDFPPDLHWYYDEKISWLHLDDDLPR